MGQQYSAPRRDVKLQVIGAGLPRSGTASFSRALEILLDGPVYHGGTQTTLGPEVEIKTWIKIMSQWPPRDDGLHSENLELLRSRTEGFAAITDSPGCGLVPELMTLYPDAKVICTVREVLSWEQSMAMVASATTQWFLRFVLFPLPSMRHFVTYIACLQRQWTCLYGETEPPPTRISYNRHIEWLKEIVPPERLVFVDVKDGWEPLCKALDVPMPKDVPFPQVNDGKAIDAFSRKIVLKGLGRWAFVFAAGAAGFMALPRMF